MNRIKYFIFITFLQSISAGMLCAMVKTTKTAHRAVPTDLVNASEKKQLAAIDAAVQESNKLGTTEPLESLGKVLNFKLLGEDIAKFSKHYTYRPKF